MMRKIAQDAFHRVQRLSTDWHSNSFAGSTVRKITRGMWALDSLNDVLLLALLPSVVVLAAAVVMMANHWPIMGLVMVLGAAAYVVMAVMLATRVIAPASRLSNALDTRMGGTLADALSSNAVVRSFGAEYREEERLTRVIDKWSRRTRRTWFDTTWSSTGQLGVAVGGANGCHRYCLVAVVAGSCDPWRNHVRVDDVFRRARLLAGHRAARASPAACRQRDGRDGAPLRRAPRRS